MLREIAVYVLMNYYNQYKYNKTQYYLYKTPT